MSHGHCAADSVSRSGECEICLLDSVSFFCLILSLCISGQGCARSVFLVLFFFCPVQPSHFLSPLPLPLLPGLLSMPPPSCLRHASATCAVVLSLELFPCMDSGLWEFSRPQPCVCPICGAVPAVSELSPRRREVVRLPDRASAGPGTVWRAPLPAGIALRSSLATRLDSRFVK